MSALSNVSGKVVRERERERERERDFSWHF